MSEPLRKVVDNDEPAPRCNRRPNGKKCNGFVRVTKQEPCPPDSGVTGTRYHGKCKRCGAKLVRDEGWRVLEGYSVSRQKEPS